MIDCRRSETDIGFILVSPIAPRIRGPPASGIERQHMTVLRRRGNKMPPRCRTASSRPGSNAGPLALFNASHPPCRLLAHNPPTGVRDCCFAPPGP